MRHAVENVRKAFGTLSAVPATVTLGLFTWYVVRHADLPISICPASNGRGRTMLLSFCIVNRAPVHYETPTARRTNSIFSFARLRAASAPFSSALVTTDGSAESS